MHKNLIKYHEYLIARKRATMYCSYLNGLFEYLDTQKLTYDDMTQEILTNYLNQHKYYASSINNLLKAGRDYNKFLGITDENNIFYTTKLLKTERKIPNYLTDKELDQAISYLITNHSKRMNPAKIETILYFLFYSAVRKNELLLLKRSDVNLEENCAKVYGKGQKERIIYFPTKVKDKLLRFFSSEVEETNAFNITLGQINYIARLLKRFFPDKKMTTHLWRHSGARDMIMKGVPLGIVSKILGHSSLTTTAIYTDPDEEMIRKMYREHLK